MQGCGKLKFTTDSLWSYPPLCIKDQGINRISELEKNVKYHRVISCLLSLSTCFFQVNSISLVGLSVLFPDSAVCP